MIGIHVPAMAWAPPKAAMVTPAELLSIPTNFAPWVPPPPGVDPDWWPINAPQQVALSSWAEMLLFGGQSGGGKRLDLETPICTVGGWTTMRDIRLGETIFDEQGQPTTVTFVGPVVMGDSYKIVFHDGSEILADREHLWFTSTERDRQSKLTRTEEWRARRRASRPSRAIENALNKGSQKTVTERNRQRKYIYLQPSCGAVRSTAEIAASLHGNRGSSNHAIAVCGALETPDLDLPLPPYTLGVWLGDGSHDSGRYTSEDAQIAEEIRAEGFKVVHHPSHRHSWGIWKWETLARKHGLLFNKHIPDVYFRSSIAQRLALLQGLMDTDGDCGLDGRAEFTSTRKNLAEGVRTLVLSLGLKATISEGKATLYGRDCGPKWRVGWTDALQVFRLRRKASRIKTALRGCQRRRFIVAVEKVLDRPMRCIAVDSPSHLYLAGKQLIPTHNTDFLVGDAIQEYWLPSFRGLLLRPSLGEMDQISDRL